MKYLSFIITYLLAISISNKSLSNQETLTEPITIDKLEKFLISNNIQTIEEFLAKLNTNIRSQYVLMNKSLSLQSASYQKPRVIMYSDTAQMLMSFNSDNNEKNGDKIEIILYDKSKAKFEAHEIAFHNNEFVINKNPKSCNSCHGQDLRPNWNSYSIWPGAYGENDDRLYKSISNTNKDEYRDDFRDFYELQIFFKNHKDHPRYQYLLKLDQHLYLGNEHSNFTQNTPPLYKKTTIQSNSQLTDLIFKMNTERIIRILKSNKYYNNFKYSVLLQMSHCRKHTIGGDNPFLDSLPSELKNHLLTKVPSVNSNLKNNKNYYDVELQEQLLYLFLREFEIDTDSLDTNFNFSYVYEDNLLLNAQLRTPRSALQEFAQIFTREDNELATFLTTNNKHLDCNRLVSIARTSMENLYPQSFSIKIDNNFNINKKVFFDKCLKCHNTTKNAGFEFNEEILKRKFSENSKLVKEFLYRIAPDTPTNKKMPKNATLTPNEREQITKYIKSLSSK